MKEALPIPISDMQIVIYRGYYYIDLSC
jgi:hypothetical protein